MQAPEPVFERLQWKRDRVLLDELVFRLEDTKEDSWELGEECFRFYKTRRMYDQYRNFWTTRPDFRPRNLIELGIFDGGSIAFWFEHFQPDKYIALDLQSRGEGMSQ